ncbi:phage baseplate plug family protein [Agrobacterium pusense]|uniref:phage baseplate plug family protein n=1 Tax=Agrobacterium pusense TaxID=648995 RepID=UPI003A5C3CF7
MNSFSIIDAADQQFGTIINGHRVTIRVRYNPSSDRWSFDLSIDDQPVLHGRRIVTGIDLLEAFQKSFLRKFQFDIGALVAVPVKAGINPDRQSLPNGTIKLLHFSSDEIDALRGEKWPS